MKSKRWIKNYDNMKLLVETEAKLNEMYKDRRSNKENEAISKLKTNPRYFYSYAKWFYKTSNQMGQLVNKAGIVITDSLEKAEMLREQYDSVNSIPRENFKIDDPNSFFDTVDSGIETDEEEYHQVEANGLEPEGAERDVQMQPKKSCRTNQ